MENVHAVGIAFSKDSETVCEHPLCDVRFPQTGWTISPKRFCSNILQATSIAYPPCTRRISDARCLPDVRAETLWTYRPPRLREPDIAQRMLADGFRILREGYSYSVHVFHNQRSALLRGLPCPNP